MEIVTGDPAPTLDRDEAALLLREMAAVVRTIYGVTAPTTTAPVAVPAAPAAMPALAVPTGPAPVVAAPAPVQETQKIPVIPAIPVPDLPAPAPETGDPTERHSMSLLQQLAFLED